MANTTLSSIGGVLQDSRANELIIAALGDGTAKPGDIVGVLATGKVQQSDIDGSQDLTSGILLPNPKYDMDTAIGDGIPCEVVIPQGGHIYGVHVDTTGDATMGDNMFYHANTGGILDEGASAEAEHVAKLFKGAASDTYVLVTWGA